MGKVEQINFRQWRLTAAVVDAGILRLEIEALDGTDIVEVSEPGAEREGEQYTLHLSTLGLEEAQLGRRSEDASTGVDADEDEASSQWLADEDETLYLRGWEVNALIDEDGLLAVNVQRGLGSEIYEIEPVDITGSGAPRIVLRLASEEAEEDNDEGVNEDDGDDGDTNEYGDLDELDDDYEDVDVEDGDFDDDLYDDEDYR